MVIGDYVIAGGHFFHRDADVHSANWEIDTTRCFNTWICSHRQNRTAHIR